MICDLALRFDLRFANHCLICMYMYLSPWRGRARQNLQHQRIEMVGAQGDEKLQWNIYLGHSCLDTIP